ncbi:MAG: uracil-DNA glycosylase family protein [Endomicrobia bacterium]|nr:uracil-DNA glycosylase family protein [Endomicrobiia bacterium]MDW8056124.1 uracil-DNA glycosylase family protein [Elusimicrobiota bacterium]
MNNILNDLEKITSSCINGNFQRNNLCICSRCTLRNSGYSLCFYTNTLIKKNINQKGVVIMFISRDPNIDVNTVRNVNYKTIDIVLEWKEPKKIGLGNFFYDFLYKPNRNNLWSEFLNYLEALKNTGISNIVVPPRFYWTHLVKCYAENNANIVNQAKEHCIDYLKEEIEAIKPQLIITAGKDVGNAVASIFPLQKIGSTIKDINTKIFAAYQNKNSKIICIPHPSQAPYQMWKNGTKDFGIKFKDLKKLINNLICCHIYLYKKTYP